MTTHRLNGHSPESLPPLEQALPSWPDLDHAEGLRLLVLAAQALGGPGPRGVRVRLEVGGRLLRLSIGPVATATDTQPLEPGDDAVRPPSLFSCGLAVLRLLAAETRPLLGKVIAARLQFRYDASIRMDLSLLHKLGLVRNSQGYFITPAGRRALEADAQRQRADQGP